MPFELVVHGSDKETRRVSMQGDVMSLGRAHTNDLSYPEDASLSRQHVSFTHDESGWWIEDLKSKNGTFLNDTRITTKHLLRPRDRIVAGHLAMTLVEEGEELSENFEFVQEAGVDINPDATVMTSLEGLISAEGTVPPEQQTSRPLAGEVLQRQIFQTSEVQVLIRAGRLLADRMPLEDLFPHVLGLSIEAVDAERGILLTLEGDSLVSRAVHGEGFRISTTVRDRVIKEKTSLLVRNLQQDEALKAQVSIFEQQIQTMMAVPLQTEDRVIGLIYLDSKSFVREFTPDDLNLLTVLANIAAIRIEHERFVELERREQVRTQDLQQAAIIQSGILPSEAPCLEGFDISGHNQASRTVGGDYYDYIPYENGRLGVTLADVAGKGMSAALVMTNLQAAVRILAERPCDLAEMMTRLDQSVYKNTPTNRFVTMFFAMFDAASRELNYCNAGHNSPLLLRESGEIETLDPQGTVLGVLPELGYQQARVTLQPGDLLAIFSDGVTEAESPDEEEYGDDRLAELLKRLRDESSANIVQEIVKDVDRFTNGAPPADDITVVIARCLK
ncbi:MAG: SpoIIE family protein phosphatase [Acidobacteriota bacterium]|nr:SpoIIE family protein phosphatase [Acidobacteriota bacterium]MDH3786014.1 SpoIIE family protein phosphatase [Acidobacteriota bacterium]